MTCDVSERDSDLRVYKFKGGIVALRTDKPNISMTWNDAFIRRWQLTRNEFSNILGLTSEAWILHNFKCIIYLVHVL